MNVVSEKVRRKVLRRVTEDHPVAVGSFHPPKIPKSELNLIYTCIRINKIANTYKTPLFKNNSLLSKKSKNNKQKLIMSPLTKQKMVSQTIAADPKTEMISSENVPKAPWWKFGHRIVAWFFVYIFLCFWLFTDENYFALISTWLFQTPCIPTASPPVKPLAQPREVAPKDGPNRSKKWLVVW